MGDESSRYRKYELMSEYHRGYVDGARSLDAERAAIAQRLRGLALDGGSHENLSQIAGALWHSDFGWTEGACKKLRDKLIDLIGGAHVTEPSTDVRHLHEQYQDMREQRDEWKERCEARQTECESIYKELTSVRDAYTHMCHSRDIEFACYQRNDYHYKLSVLQERMQAISECCDELARENEALVDLLRDSAEDFLQMSVQCDMWYQEWEKLLNGKFASMSDRHLAEKYGVMRIPERVIAALRDAEMLCDCEDGGCPCAGM